MNWLKWQLSVNTDCKLNTMFYYYVDFHNIILGNISFNYWLFFSNENFFQIYIMPLYCIVNVSENIK